MVAAPAKGLPNKKINIPSLWQAGVAGEAGEAGEEESNDHSRSQN
ncbi:hypothetical protein [Nostoc commune]|nr:hypothetical protein [Nostoc commune]